MGCNDRGRRQTTNPWKSKNHSTVPGLMLVISLAMLARLSAGCSSSSSAQPKAPAPVEVGVAEVICKQIDDSDDFTGRLEAVHAVEVRPRVSGYLQSVHFKEGEDFSDLTHGQSPGRHAVSPVTQIGKTACLR